MNSTTISQKDREMAKKCIECVPCRKARKHQKGFFFFVVKAIEDDICPYCVAYEKVYGVKAHVSLN